MSKINAAKYLAMEMVRNGWDCRAYTPGGHPVSNGYAQGMRDFNTLWRAVEAQDRVRLVFDSADPDLADEALLIDNLARPGEQAKVERYGVMRDMWAGLVKSGAFNPEDKGIDAEVCRARYAFNEATADWTELGGVDGTGPEWAEADRRMQDRSQAVFYLTQYRDGSPAQRATLKKQYEGSDIQGKFPALDAMFDREQTAEKPYNSPYVLFTTNEMESELIDEAPAMAVIADETMVEAVRRAAEVRETHGFAEIRIDEGFQAFAAGEDVPNPDYTCLVVDDQGVKIAGTLHNCGAVFETTGRGITVDELTEFVDSGRRVHVCTDPGANDDDVLSDAGDMTADGTDQARPAEPGM